MQSLIGTKKSQSQRFLENGTRIPVTLIDIKNNFVISHKTAEKDKYQAVQLGISAKKKATKAELGHVKGAKLDKAPKFLREVHLADGEDLPEIGSTMLATEVFAPGDIVNVSGFSKGKGFAGVVKRHGFRGGPKTHGQSDRHRAPGAIGQGTTPGRVYRGKRMAGRMGSENVTITNLEVVDVNEDILTLKGLVPGVINGLIVVKKVGTDAKFVPLWKEPSDAEALEEQGKTEELQTEEAKPEEQSGGDSSVSDDAQTADQTTQAEDSSSLNDSSAPTVDSSNGEAGEPAANPSENAQAPVTQDNNDQTSRSSESEDSQPTELATDAVTGEPAGEVPTTQDATPEEAENVENEVKGEENANS